MYECSHVILGRFAIIDFMLLKLFIWDSYLSTPHGVLIPMPHVITSIYMIELSHIHASTNFTSVRCS